MPGQCFTSRDRDCFSGAALATVVFALAPCHMMPLAWLANREALVSFTFGLLGLVALDSKTPFWVLVLVVAAALGFLVRPIREAIACLDDASRRGVLALLVGSVLAMLPAMSVGEIFVCPA